jgi:hypothetical protein
MTDLQKQESVVDSKLRYVRTSLRAFLLCELRHFPKTMGFKLPGTKERLIKINKGAYHVPARYPNY